MNFIKFQEIKDKVEKLPNVNFYSFNEDTIIVKNTKNQALYQIPFTEEQDETLTLHLQEGEQVTEATPTLEEEFISYKKGIKNSVKKIFSNYNEGVSDLKKYFQELPQIDIDSLKKDVNEKKSFAEAIDVYSKSDFEPIRNINKKFKKQLIEMNEDKKEFINLLNIFDENNNLKSYDLNYDHFKSMYNESMLAYEEFNNTLKKMSKFHKAVERIVMNEDIAKNIIEKLDYTESAKISVPKTLVKVKQLYKEDEFKVSITDASKKIIKTYNEFFDVEGDSAPVLYNKFIDGGDEIPKYLKFSNGKYSTTDVQTLAHELEQSYYVLSDLTPEDLMQIADWRNQCEYMSRTNMISDKKVDEIINGFNKRFTVNSAEEFNDGDMALGFKDSEEMDMENADGIAYDGSSVKDDDIEGELEYDDEEDFEEVKGAAIA